MYLFFLSMARIAHEEWKVYGNVFDQYTDKLLVKLCSQNHFSKLQSPVSIGKEANIFTAITNDNDIIIVKIYRLESCNFNKMYDYIKSDGRFEKLKKQRRKVIFTWVNREYQNILRARSLGVRVPKPITVKDHVILLEIIGDKSPAPKLKDVSDEEVVEVYDKIVDDMKKMHKGGLVHGDLSEFNILVHNSTPFIIDFSQGTTLKDPNYEEYWDRDIKNMVRFFKKSGIKISEEELKKKIGFE